MKRFLLRPILCPMSMLAFSLFSATLPAQVVQGTLDSVDSSTCEVAGWARDPQNTAPINVQFYRDGDTSSGVLVTTTGANLLRADLPYTDQNHGFHYTFIGNAGLADGKDHTIYAFGVAHSGTTGPLSGNRKILHCGVLTATAASYGATGDGTTDDSGAIQAAINDTAPGGKVIIPKGTYIIGTSHGQQGAFGPNTCGVDPNSQEQSGLMVNRSNLEITGAGRSTILKLANKVKMRIITVVAPNTTIEKLVLDGNGANRVQIDPTTGRPYSWPCGFVVDGLLSGDAAPVGNVTIRDIESRNGIEDGMGLFATPNLTVQSVYVHNNGGYGINPAYKESAGGSAISLSGGANQTAVDNVIIGNTYGPTVGFGAVGVNISYNVSFGNCSSGLILGTGPSSVPPPQPDSNFTVTRNWVEHNGTTCVNGAVDIVGGQDGAFSNNYVINNAYPGILFTDKGAPWPASINWQMLNNVVANNLQSGVWVQGRSSGIVLRGNEIENNGTNLASQVVIDPSAMAGVNADWSTVNTYTYSPPATIPQAPTITATSIVNAASEQPGGISPGEILAIYGSNLGPAKLVTAAPNSDGRLERILSGTRVLFDGVPGAMLYSVAAQVAVIAPYYLYWKDSTNVEVEYNGVKSNSVTVPIQQSQPAVFTTNASGQGPGAILNQDYSGNSAAKPGARGSIVTIYATGEGQTDPAGVDGLLASATLPRPRLPVSVRVGGVDAEVVYAGAVPTSVAGVMQIDARIPATAPVGTTVPVQISVGNATSQVGVTLAVH